MTEAQAKKLDGKYVKLTVNYFTYSVDNYTVMGIAHVHHIVNENGTKHIELKVGTDLIKWNDIKLIKKCEIIGEDK